MFVRKTKFNLLFQPKRIGKRKTKARLARRFETKYKTRTKMQDCRANAASRRTRILGRFNYLRMITIYNVKYGIIHRRKKSKSFMLKRVL